jgi:hypothetical protein
MTNQDYTIMSYIVLGVTLLVMALYFRSVWVRKGYEGKNQILELFEVTRFYKHIMGFLFMIVLELMIFSKQEFPVVAWTIVLAGLAGFNGTELYLDFRKSLKTINK